MAAAGYNRKRSTQVLLYRDATPAEAIAGEGETQDLSNYVTRAIQRESEADLTLTWHGNALSGANQPQPGQWVRLLEGGQSLWLGFIAEVSEYRLSRGERRLRLALRSRAAMPFWRNVKRVTDVFSAGTQYEAIAAAVAETLSLGSSEYHLGGIGLSVVQQNVQLADLTAWEMLETLLLPAGLEPYVNAQGILTHISRDTTRLPKRTLTGGEVLAVNGSKQALGVNRVRVKWLDPQLTRDEQQDQRLASATITAGFFQLKQEQTLHWSSDARQRAGETYLVIRQSCNSGLLPVASENYSAIDEVSGRIILRTSVWVPTLATASLASYLAASEIPDAVKVFSTVSVGRVIQATAQVAILVIMMSIGTGQYEIWGRPFDYIHAVNTSEAYLCNAPAWLEEVVEIENDLVTDEAHAQTFSQRELRYRTQASDRWGVEAADTDPHLQRGDILQLPSGEKLYVTGFTRDLTRGAPCKVSIDGFRVR